MPACRRKLVMARSRQQSPRRGVSRENFGFRARRRFPRDPSRGRMGARHLLTSDGSSGLPSAPVPQLHRAIVHQVNPYLAALVTAAGYWLGTQVGLLLTPTDLAVSVMWPPNAMLLAAFMLTPRSWWPLNLLAILP